MEYYDLDNYQAVDYYRSKVNFLLYYAAGFEKFKRTVINCAALTTFSLKHLPYLNLWLIGLTFGKSIGMFLLFVWLP